MTEREAQDVIHALETLSKHKAVIGCESCAKTAEFALEVLKELKEQKNQILKAVWDVLHEGVSTDTVADQDWVYERIRHRIEDT